MFWVFDEYLPKDCFSLLVLTPLRIYDHETGQNNQILGRATGDRIAIVTTKDQNEKELFLTCAHELLHTMGVDHCVDYKCLMNGYISGGKHLCPIDMQKLREITKISFKERLNNLVSFYEENSWKEELKWTKLLISQINNYD